VEIHFVVALDQAVEDQRGKTLGLGVGAETGIEIGGIGFDDEDYRGGVVGGVGAGEEEKTRDEEERESQKITTEGEEEAQSSQRRERKGENRK
jgi:hypothetical protein